jgi:hypothetical protein
MTSGWHSLAIFFRVIVFWACGLARNGCRLRHSSLCRGMCDGPNLGVIDV